MFGRALHSKSIAALHTVASLTLFKRGLFRVAHVTNEKGPVKGPPFLNFVTLSYNDETQYNCALSKKTQKYVNHDRHPMSSIDISIFSPEISNFYYIKKCRYSL